MRIEVSAGPDAGWWAELQAGRYLVGRERHCALSIDDPAIEANHLLLDIDPDGRVDAVQLAGRVPISVTPSHIDVGSSRLDLVPRSPVAGLVLGVSMPDTLGCGRGGDSVLLEADSLAIVDDDPELARGLAIVRSLQSQATRHGLTAPAHVLTAPDDPALDGCTAMLEVGARWRARWTPDVTQPEHSIRLHAAGLSRSCVREQ